MPGTDAGPWRPEVSVVVPFRGTAEQARRMLAGLRALKLAPGDEVMVAENSTRGIVEPLAGPEVTVVPAVRERSSYHARNAGAAAASGEWLLFMDADCTPAVDLIGAYFAPRPAPACGAVAGQIEGDPDQRSFVARYMRSRQFFRQDTGFLAEAGAAATGNLLVRRSAFEAVQGFTEGIRSGGDVDLCRRLRAAGWTLEIRTGAVVSHRHRESLASLLGAIARYAAGSRWLNGRYPGESERWPLLPGVAGVVRDIASRVRAGRLEEAAFRAVDGLGLIAHVVGYAAGNRAGEIN